MSDKYPITELLHQWRGGDASARDRLMPMVVDDLRAIARRHLYREHRGHTLQPTELVNELYLKLVHQKKVHWDDRREFFAVASRMIRWILVDHARRNRANKRDRDLTIRLDQDEPMSRDTPTAELVRLDDVMQAFKKIDPKVEEIVEMHFFGGLTFVEIAEVVGRSRAQVHRDWKYARLWLSRELAAAPDEDLPDGDEDDEA